MESNKRSIELMEVMKNLSPRLQGVLFNFIQELNKNVSDVSLETKNKGQKK